MATWTLRQVVASTPMLVLTSSNVGGVTALRTLEFDVTLPTAPTAGQVLIWKTDGVINDRGGPGRGHVIRADQIASQSIKLLMDPFLPGPHSCTIQLMASDGTTPIYPVSPACVFTVLTTPPVISAVNKTSVAGTSANFTFTTDQDNGIAYYVACSSPQPTITFAQIKAGHDASNAPATYAGNQTISTVGPHTGTAIGLPTMTTIYLYVVQENAVGLKSNIGTVAWGQGNTLRTGLVSYWKLDEATGGATDAHGTNHLTAEGTGGTSPGTAPGVINGGRDFVVANQQGLFVLDAAAPSLSMGDDNFAISTWFKGKSLTSHQNIVGKWNGPDQYEYILMYNAIPHQFAFYVTHNGTTAVGVVSNTVTPVVGVMYNVIVEHDKIANLLRMSVNDVAQTPVAHTLGVFNGSGRFGIGARDSYYVNNSADAIIDETVIWARTLSAYDKTTIFAGGAGLPYSEFA